MATVLVVDDEIAFRSFVRDSLNTWGHEVVEAANGKEGLIAYRQHKPDLVITDIFMNERGGLSLIRDLRSEFPESRIVITSGGSLLQTSGFIHYAKQLGITASLKKPFSVEVLAAVVDKVLRDRTPSVQPEPVA